MIFNIVDSRKRPYRWKTITAIIEPTYHDNNVADSDHTESMRCDPEFDKRAEISLADAVAWAQSLAFPVTLFLYDLGEGIRVVDGATAHFLSVTGQKPGESKSGKDSV